MNLSAGVIRKRKTKHLSGLPKKNGTRNKKSMNQVKFRFYEELNDHLPEEKRKVGFEYNFSEGSSLSDAFNSMDIPNIRPKK